MTCINRGGGWFDLAESLSCYTRDLVSSSSRRDNLGFRLCATPSPAAEETHAESAETVPHAETAEGAAPAP